MAVGDGPPGAKQGAPDQATIPGDAEARAALGQAPTTPHGGSPKGGGGSGKAGVTIPAFAAGDVLAGRYRVVRFIAQGGMGDVYEAEDLELHEHVALKTVRPDIGADERVIERFKREIQLARKVTHPNVCRIFDVGYHVVAATQTKITFLTMEFLAGETLGERLGRSGPMKPCEALPIVRQMTAALSAAHKVGVIHRDFKTGNVVLVPSPGGETRAVVTDFGLARTSGVEVGGAGSDREAAALTRAGDMLGSPPYMAPEQIEDGDITPATDLYALGVVLYEMVTGTWPFVGKTPLATAIKRLKEDPPAPRTVVAGLDPKWDAAILRSLARKPKDRFASAEEVTAALGGPSELDGAVKAALWRHKKRRIALALALFALLFLVGKLLDRQTATRPANTHAAAPSQGARPRPSVAVLGFKNLSGRAEADWYSTALSETLGTELAAGGKLRTVPGENVAHMKSELALADVDSYSQETLARIRKILSADYVVLGSYMVMGQGGDEKLRLDLRVQDAQAGETRVSLSETGSQRELSEVVARVGDRIRKELGLGELSALEASSMRATLPENPEAARLYAEGLEKLRRYDQMAARQLLEKAVALDPSYPLAHSALAEACDELNYDGEAKAHAKQAFDLSSTLSKEERLLVEARYRIVNDEREKALGIYRTLFGYSPDNLEYGLKLAEMQARSMRPKEAQATIDTLRKLPPPASDDPRIDLREAWTQLSSDFKRAHAATERALAKGKAQGARRVMAEAELAQYLTYLILAQPEKSNQAIEDAKQLYAAIGDRGSLADSLMTMGSITANIGNVEVSRKLLEEGLAIWQKLGEPRGIARGLRQLSETFKLQGDFAQARQKLDQALAIYRKLDEKRRMVSTLVQIASLMQEQSEFSGASKRCEEALALARKAGTKEDQAKVLRQSAALLREQGQLDAALTKFEEALSLSRQEGTAAEVAETLEKMGELLQNKGELPSAKTRYQEALDATREAGFLDWSMGILDMIARIDKEQGDLSAARKKVEEALAMGSQRGGNLQAAFYKIDLADLTFEEGDFRAAEQHARENAAEFEHQKVSIGVVWALEVLAKSLLAQGKIPDARASLDRAKPFAAGFKTGSFYWLKLGFALTEGRVRAASSDPTDQREGLAEIKSALADAGKRRNRGFELEARYALGEAELRAGDAARARTDLAIVEKDARALGYGLIARKALKLLGNPPHAAAPAGRSEHESD